MLACFPAALSLPEQISPVRGGDAFSGKTPTRSFRDIMAEQALAKEKDQVRQSSRGLASVSVVAEVIDNNRCPVVECQEGVVVLNFRGTGMKDGFCFAFRGKTRKGGSCFVFREAARKDVCLFSLCGRMMSTVWRDGRGGGGEEGEGGCLLQRTLV